VIADDIRVDWVDMLGIPCGVVDIEHRVVIVVDPVVVVDGVVVRVTWACTLRVDLHREEGRVVVECGDNGVPVWLVSFVLLLPLLLLYLLDSFHFVCLLLVHNTVFLPKTIASMHFQQF